MAKYDKYIENQIGEIADMAENLKEPRSGKIYLDSEEGQAEFFRDHPNDALVVNDKGEVQSILPNFKPNEVIKMN